MFYFNANCTQQLFCLNQPGFEPGFLFQNFATGADIWELTFWLLMYSWCFMKATQVTFKKPQLARAWVSTKSLACLLFQDAPAMGKVSVKPNRLVGNHIKVPQGNGYLKETNYGFNQNVVDKNHHEETLLSQWRGNSKGCHFKLQSRQVFWINIVVKNKTCFITVSFQCINSCENCKVCVDLPDSMKRSPG